ncbi:MAG: hypothetical protein GY716_11015 [bacterium]|nr:hypothetical protein [bacterium]
MKPLFLLLALLGSVPCVSGGGRDAPSLELELRAALLAVDADLSSRERFGERLEPAASAAATWLLRDHWAAFLQLGTAEPSIEQDRAGARMTTLRAGATLYLRPHWRRSQYFARFGLGNATVDPSGSRDFSRPEVSLGFGRRRLQGRRARAAWEIRVDRSLGTAGPDDAPWTHLSFGVILGWDPASRPAPGAGRVDPG